jgi:chaperonin GroES
MKMRMLSNRVLAEAVTPLKVTEGGIIIPETAHDDRAQPAEGIVVSVGPGSVDDHGVQHPINLKKGDHILFSPHSPVQIKIDGTVYLVLQEHDILGTKES